MSYQGILLLHLISTLYMMGLIWFVQIVHYPQLRIIPEGSFERYAEDHQLRTSFVVVPPMLLEAVTAFVLTVASNTNLLFEGSLAGRSRAPGLTNIGAVLLILIWTSTFLIQVPCHQKLLQGKDCEVIDRLVKSNWIRTIGWTLRSATSLALVWP